MQHGIDTYGQGRCPFYLEPSIIVVITDGGKLTSNSGVADEVSAHCVPVVDSNSKRQNLISIIIHTY